MLKQRKKWIVFLTLLLVAAAFRVGVAHWFPNDAPDDGRTYAQIARNVLEQHVYSHETEAPYDPSLIRLPGYPLFLAAIYSVFGLVALGCLTQMWAANSSSRWSSYFCFISSSDSPTSAPEVINIQLHSEQPEP